jgi:hypothetical protein
VALPAHEIGDARQQHVLPDGDVGENDDRPDHEDQHDHADQYRRVLRDRGVTIGEFHQRHQPADEDGDHHVDQRNCQARREYSQIPPAGLPHEVPVERQQPGGRNAGTGGGRATDAGLEVAEHAGQLL